MTNNIIKVKNLTFTYNEAKHPAVDDISFNIQRGTWTAIIGHNGSGKSTIVKLLNGLLVPDENTDGRIEIDVQELTEETVWNIRNQIGVVFQNPDNQFVGATVADDVAFGLENRQVPRSKMLQEVPQAVEAVNMTSYADTEPANLSGGQKQRVAIAGILAIKPKIIILDEATSMLDPEGRKNILEIVQRLKQENDMTVISITHDIDEAAIADQVIVMNDGKLVDQGTAEAVFSKAEMLRNLGLDVPFYIKVKEKLQECGIAIPEEIKSEKRLINFLCQLNSNK